MASQLIPGRHLLELTIVPRQPQNPDPTLCYLSLDLTIGALPLHHLGPLWESELLYSAGIELIILRTM